MFARKPEYRFRKLKMLNCFFYQLMMCTYVNKICAIFKLSMLLTKIVQTFSVKKQVDQHL